jgi:hypothetical protein
MEGEAFICRAESCNLVVLECPNCSFRGIATMGAGGGASWKSMSESCRKVLRAAEVSLSRHWRSGLRLCEVRTACPAL